MAEPVHARRFSAGVVVVHLGGAAVQYLLLRAYKNWDFPKGLVEPGEQPFDAAVREVKEEARWAAFETALSTVSPRLKPVIQWASNIIAASAAGAPASIKE